MSILKCIVFVFSIILFVADPASAQLSGSRGGLTYGGSPGGSSSSLQSLPPEVAQSYITFDGTAELRVKPTEIRVVLAVTAEGATADQCARTVKETIQKLTTQWTQSGIDKANIVEDFIAVLPRYDFEVQTLRDRQVAMEKKSGYLMQTNLHLAVKDDAEAMKAVNIAFANGISDIIGFDYWSSELDKIKVKAREEALKAAKEKSDALLDVLLENRPPIINLQESTQVYYPETLYTSFTNDNSAEYQSGYSRNDIPQLRLFRPKNTYYRGLYSDGDVQSKELPMRSEIYVVSTVRLYFQSPAAKDYLSAGKQFNTTRVLD